MRIKGVADAEETLNEIQLLEGALEEYRDCLNRLYQTGGSSVRDLNALIDRVLKRYKQAYYTLRRFQGGAGMGWWNRMMQESSRREGLLVRAVELRDDSTGEVQEYAEAYCSAHSSTIWFYSQAAVKTMELALGHMDLPPELEGIRMRRRWITVIWIISFVVAGLGLIGLLKPPYLVAVIFGSAGFVMVLLQKYCLSNVLFPGSSIPSRLAIELREELSVVEAKVAQLKRYSSALQGFNIAWPESLDETLHKLVTGQTVPREELISGTSVAERHRDQVRRIQSEYVSHLAIEKRTSDSH